MTHIVFMKFPDQHISKQVQEKLLGMRGQIPSLREIEVGLDVTRSERSWDLALLTRFDDQAGLDAYATHPVHIEVLGYIREHLVEVAAIDY